MFGKMNDIEELGENLGNNLLKIPIYKLICILFLFVLNLILVLGFIIFLLL